ncbi:Asp-tRNA(Asn)/Glu-tRNA(Gln) amidotransferase subunit GatB [Botrimarina sp.]|uniref:Asp-tRNA(Asn)/Glu-tRNA(Gln) amidotransferase subunit GatB n=1 Tax=Botrimarina sp. TaxID=2795802 RepID=UPI0032EDBC85
MDYQTIVGLEVHVQLATQSKLFCGCPTTFGAAPNTQVCPVCLGLPGSLPVINARAVELARVVGVALDCETPSAEHDNYTKWDRKQYFYPDLPKGYQTSQFDLPITETGGLDIALEDGQPKRVRITRAHLEEDAGKSLHDESGAGGDSVIDLNRAGTPLLEIVSEPDLRSGAEAKAYLEELKLLLTYLAVSDCNMQEGSLRVDANVNLHVPDPAGGGKPAATPIVEIKNLNSFRAVERAIEYEAQRQWRDWQETGRRLGQAPKQTRGWDDSAEVTRPQREKEESSDYRYFPCPDLEPVVTTAAEVERLRSGMPELPAALRLRLQADHGLSAYDAGVIVNQGRDLADYFLAVAQQSGDAKQSANWVTQHVLRVMNAEGKTLDGVGLPAGRLAAMIQKLTAGDLPSPRAREVFETMIAEDTDCDAAMKSLGIEAVDESELVALCEQLLDKNPKIVADVKGGNEKAVGALIGQAKKHNPNADPGRVRAICLELIAQRDA